MNHNYVNAEQIGGFSGHGWNRNDSLAGSVYTIPYGQSGVCGRLYAIYYWNSAKDTVYKLNSSRYGSSQHFAEADFGSVRHTDDSLADAAYFGRSHNINRWG